MPYHSQTFNLWMPWNQNNFTVFLKIPSTVTVTEAEAYILYSCSPLPEVKKCKHSLLKLYAA